MYKVTNPLMIYLSKFIVIFLGLDMESRNNKKRCMGRVTKNLADLTLQAGLVSDALNIYHSAAEVLKSVNDWLWLAAAKEGMVSMFVAQSNAQSIKGSPPKLQIAAV